MRDRRPPLPGGPYLVVGLARSGQAAARVLADRGERVIGCDAGSPIEADDLCELGIGVHLGTRGTELLDDARCVVKSPGVPGDAPVVAAARERGAAVIGELELAWRLIPNRFVAVTGTNGKTTVTELLGHLWRAAGEPVAVAGNVGTPLASLVGRVRPDSTVVCECSSFQLEDTDAFAPECAVFLNLSADHLDRHPTLDAYRGAKLAIFANQEPEDVAVYNAEQLGPAELPGRGRRIGFCEGRPLACDATLAGGAIWWGPERLIEASDLRLLGAHNAVNATAAAAAALAMGLDVEAVRAGLASFPGVPHRLERIAEVAGVSYVNDSKATNVVATLAALRSFPGGIRVILGGRPKGESFAPLLEEVRKRCRGCYLIGEAEEPLWAELRPAQGAGVVIRRCGALPYAVDAAAADAAAGDVVLLSPACASFDAYRDFEERGEHFRALVGGLGRR